MAVQSRTAITGTVLVADDHESNRDLLEELLTSQGFKVVTVPDGRAALEESSKAEADLIILDVMMPHLTGFEVCAEVKNNPETSLIPIILITALSEKEDRIKGIKAGADDFLTRPVDRTELLARVQSLMKLKHKTDELERAEAVLFSLARSIESKDPYTHGHCERLAEYSSRLGEKIGLPEDHITALRRAGVVHDIGKVAVPDRVLLKRASLSSEEWVIMREHSAVGERICAPLKSFRLVLPIIRHHHEKFDGSGYPDGLCGEAIPMTARVLQLADVFDALTTERPYKKALTLNETLRIMRQEVAKGWWDPQLYQPFEQLILERGWNRTLSAAAAN